MIWQNELDSYMEGIEWLGKQGLDMYRNNIGGEDNRNYIRILKMIGK